MAFHIRRAVAGDLDTLRALRIAALTDAPGAFASTLERERTRTQAEWQRWLSPNGTFIAFESDRPIGLAGGILDQHDRSVVHVVAMWVHPALRGSGVADALVDAVVAWASGEGVREVRLRIAKGNDRAQRCYERNGFRVTGREDVREADGFVEVEMQRPISR
jgi:ribosomal protein S18 acetylase RimI-like enzyme